MKTPTMPVSLTEIGFVLSIMFLVTFLMALSYSSDSLEKNLPPIDLTQAAMDGGSGITSTDFILVSIAQDKNNVTRLFVADKEISLEDLPKIIESENPKEISLRVDNGVLFGKAMEVMLKCKEHGVRRISFAYEEMK